MDWWIWRVLTHPKIKVTMRELREDWTFEDLMTAHAALDALEAAERRAIEQARAEARNGAA